MTRLAMACATMALACVMLSSTISAPALANPLPDTRAPIALDTTKSSTISTAGRIDTRATDHMLTNDMRGGDSLATWTPAAITVARGSLDTGDPTIV